MEAWQVFGATAAVLIAWVAVLAVLISLIDQEWR